MVTAAHVASCSRTVAVPGVCHGGPSCVGSGTGWCRGPAPPRPRAAAATPVWSRACVARLAAGALITAAEGNTSTCYRLAKRLLDIAGALLLLLLLAPLMLVVFLTLAITTRGRPLFVQWRIGHRGRRFPMLKFRSMQLNAAALQRHVANEQRGPVFKNRRDPRITRLGAVLRKTSIDETPQLLNVLAGHMAIVGPRPPVAQEVIEYRLWQLRRLAVKPGLTCLWQISGRSEIEFEDWVRMDLWYVQNQSLWTDLKLLLKTPRSVLTCAGAY